MVFINIHSVAKYQKTRSGDPFETLKKFRKKVAQCLKNPKGDPLGSSGFVSYLEKVKKMKGGPFGSSFALTGLGFSSFSSFCKKWTDQCEVCGQKKKATAIVWHF